MVVRWLLVVWLGVASVACAATVERSTAPADEAGAAVAVPRGTQRIVVVLVPAPGIALDDHWTAFRETWQNSLSAASTRRGVATELLGSEPASVAPGDVLVRVRVNDYRYVSQGKRIGLGVMSGNAHMDLDVAFLGPGKRSFGTRQFQTRSRAMQGIFAAMTPKQVEAVVAEIVNEAAPR